LTLLNDVALRENYGGLRLFKLSHVPLTGVTTPRGSAGRDKAVRLWVKDNLCLIEKSGYSSPEDCELAEGGYYERREADLRGQWLSAAAPQAESLGFIIVPKSEHRELVRKAKEASRDEEEARRAKLEKERLEAELKQLRSELPSFKFLVVKPFGIFKPGQTVETHNLKWAGEYVGKGFLVEKRTDVVKTALYCHAVRRMVTVAVNGEVSGDLVEGKVVECSNGRCAGAQFCWVGRHILTAQTVKHQPVSRC
jgi:hypothetical protein